MKKLIAILMAALMCMMVFASCGKTDDGDGKSTRTDNKGNNDVKEQTDMEYVKEKGELIVGITDFAPMDYQDASGNWIGFDADMAKAFAEYLGVKVTFVEIVWDNKVMELGAKTIDVVWNGMTLGDEVKAAMACSKAYCNNAQVVIVPKDKADRYATAEACKSLKFAVEAGSAGKDMAVENGFEYIEVESQAAALMEVAAGTADAAIIDSLMAAAMVGEGTSYANLTYTAKLNSEEYGVGFRKGSDLAEELNKFFDAQIANGNMEKIAEQYGVQAALIK